MDLEHLHLAELLDFRPDQGMIRLHEQRVVILSAARVQRGDRLGGVVHEYVLAP